LQKTVKKWRFPEVDYSSAKNDFGGFYNVSSHPNPHAFAKLKTDANLYLISYCWCSASMT
jgi:hypothetical protein